MRTALWAATLALFIYAACDYEERVTECSTPFRTWVSAKPIRCSLVLANTDIAHSILVPEYAVEEEWLDVANVDVFMHGSPTFTTRDGGVVRGRYARNSIQLGSGTSALLHEVFHHLDKIRGLGGGHENWTERGYFSASDEYALACVPPGIYEE